MPSTWNVLHFIIPISHLQTVGEIKSPSNGPVSSKGISCFSSRLLVTDGTSNGQRDGELIYIHRMEDVLASSSSPPPDAHFMADRGGASWKKEGISTTTSDH